MCEGDGNWGTLSQSPAGSTADFHPPVRERSVRSGTGCLNPPQGRRPISTWNSPGSKRRGMSMSQSPAGSTADFHFFGETCNSSCFEWSQSPEGSTADFHPQGWSCISGGCAKCLNPPKGRRPISTGLEVEGPAVIEDHVSIPRRVDGRFPPQNESPQPSQNVTSLNPPKGRRPISTYYSLQRGTSDRLLCLNPPKGRRPISTSGYGRDGRGGKDGCLNPPKGRRPISTGKPLGNGHQH